MNIKDLKPGSYTVVQPKKMNIKDLDPKSYTVVKPVTQPTSLDLQTPTTNIPVVKQLSDVGIGIGSAIGKAGLGLGQVALKGVGALANVMSPGASENYIKPLVQNIDTIKEKVYNEPFKKQLSTTSGKTGTFIGDAATYLAPSSAVTKGQKAVTGIVSKIPAVTKTAKFAKGALGVAGRALPEAVGAGASSLAITGGDLERAKTDALIGGGASAVLGSAGALYRGAKETGLAKNILSKTSGIPKTAFEAVEQTGINKNATPETALAKGRQAVVNLRAKNTAMWQESLPKIADEYKDIRFGLNDKQIKYFVKVAREFGVNEELIPQNLKNMSALESINLIKALNEVDSLAAKMSPRGAILRNLKKEIQPAILKQFGGEKGKIAELWKNYSTKQKILTNMDAIVNAYKTKPTQVVTAKNRLMAIFDENKPEFLKAVKDIEKEMGVNIIGDVASTKFQRILPEGTLKANGGLPTKTGIIDNLISTLLLPFTSPRLVGKIGVPAIEEAGLIEKRLMGERYANKKLNIKQSNNIDQINTTKPIIANPINDTTVKNNVIIDSKLPQNKKGAIGEAVDKFIKRNRDTPGKNGGFAKNPLAPKKTTTVSAVEKAIQEFDNSPVKTKDGLDFGNTDDTFRIEQLKDKVNAGKKLTQPEAQEAAKLLQKNGVKLGADPLTTEVKKYKSAEEFITLPKTKIEQIDKLNELLKSNPTLEIYTKENGRTFINRNVKRIRADFVDVPTASKNSQSGLRTVKEVVFEFKDGTTDKFKNPMFSLSNDSKSQLTEIWNKANNK